jgi:hypothetical protein
VRFRVQTPVLPKKKKKKIDLSAGIGGPVSGVLVKDEQVRPGPMMSKDTGEGLCA